MSARAAILLCRPLTPALIFSAHDSHQVESVQALLGVLSGIYNRQEDKAQASMMVLRKSLSELKGSNIVAPGSGKKQEQQVCVCAYVREPRLYFAFSPAIAYLLARELRDTQHAPERHRRVRPYSKF